MIELISPKKVSIVIPTFNGKKILDKCLNSILKNTDYRDFEIIVIDDSSSDGTKEMIQKNYPSVRLMLSERNEGFATACNKGLKHASGDFIVLLNNDIIVENGWLNSWLLVAEQNTNYGLIGCKLVYPNGLIQHAGGYIRPHGFLSDGFGHFKEDSLDTIKECSYVTGAAWLLRRDVLKMVGYFDTMFSPAYYEDADYCIRVKNAGFKIIYSPKPKLIHATNQTTRKNEYWYKKTYNKNRLRFQFKHYPKAWWLRPQTWVFELASMFYFAFKFGPMYIIEVYLPVFKECLYGPIKFRKIITQDKSIK